MDIYEKIKLNAMLGFAIWLAIVLLQVLFTVFIFSSFNSYKQQSYENAVNIHSMQMANKLSLIGKLERNLKTYTNLSASLQSFAYNIDSDLVIVLDNNKKAITSTTDFNYDLIDINLSKNKVKFKDHTYLVHKITLANQKQGYLVVKLNYKLDNTFAFFKDTGVVLSFAFSFVYLTIFFIVFTYKNKQAISKNQSLSKFKYIVIPYMLCLLISLSFMYTHIVTIITNTIVNMEHSVNLSIASELLHLINLNIALEDVANLQEYLSNIKLMLKDIDAIAIYKQGNFILGDNIDTYSSRLDIACSQYSIKSQISFDFYQNFVIRLVLDILTMMIIFTIIIYELLSFSVLSLKRSFKLAVNKKAYLDLNLIRPFSFFCIFAIYMPFSIISLHMLNLEAKNLKLSTEFILSLPIFIDMFFVFVASLLLLTFSKKITSHKTVLIIAISLITIAMLIASITTNAYIFLFSRVLYGLGYGCFIFGCQLYVLSTSTDSDKAQGFALFSSGIFSGLLCACIFGGVIADRYNYAMVFLSSAITLALAFIALIVIHKSYINRVPTNLSTNTTSNINFSAIKTFFKDKNILSLIFCQAIPYSALVIGLFNFFLPISLQQNGFSASSVGQINMIYTLTIILTAPLFGSLIDKSKSKYKYLTIGVVCAAIAPVFFMQQDYIVLTACIAMIFLGISTAINDSGQVAIMTSYNATSQLGNKSALLILDICLRIGQVLGPLIIASALSFADIKAFIYISLITLVLSLIFSFIQFKSNRQSYVR